MTVAIVMEVETGAGSAVQSVGEPAGGTTESAMLAAEPGCATTPKMSGSQTVADRALANVRVMWTRLGRETVCLRVHGSASQYVMSGLRDAAWRPGTPARVSLWAVDADYAGTLPVVQAWAVFGGEPLGLGAVAGGAEAA